MRFLHGCIATGLIVSTATVSVVAATPADASVSKSYCIHRSYKTVVRAYTRGSKHLPLRCGTSTWGFKHITHRWNATFDKTIALTIARGEMVTDLQGDGGTAIYALFNNKCVELFRIIYNGGALHGKSLRPQGIITAYYRSGSARARNTAPAPRYRTDCPVHQNI
ncbi:hypothetical protein AB0I58_24975 [Spirillospora sp. NPDC050365]